MRVWHLPPRTWQSVCQQLDLDADKLLAILRLRPSSVELPWLTKIETDDGGMAVNAYLIKDPQSQEAVLVDTGCNIGTEEVSGGQPS